MNNFIGCAKFHRVSCLRNTHFCIAMLKALLMKTKWSWNKIIRCWKVLEKSLIFRYCFLYEPWLSVNRVYICVPFCLAGRPGPRGTERGSQKWVVFRRTISVLFLGFFSYLNILTSFQQKSFLLWYSECIYSASGSCIVVALDMILLHLLKFTWKWEGGWYQWFIIIL